MALGDGGLDAQVEQRMDAYRGDPKKLQQRYGQNKELLDLLALQKLTSEKKQVAADMQLKAQQNPNTIAQQREQEALELTKQEMGGTLGELAGRTKGTLDQKQAMQQKNMQRMAKGAGQAPQGGLAGLMGGGARPPARPPVNPQTGGLAGARMAQAAQQPGGPRRMAAGGIVSFAEGEEVSTPFMRGLKNFFSVDPNKQKRLELERAVQRKYGLLAGVPGAFTPQTDEARQYAKDIAATFRMGSSSLSTEELQQALDANFDTGMDAEGVSTLPSFEGPDSLSETEDKIDLDGGSNDPPEVKPETRISYPSTYVDPQNILSGVDTTYEPSIAEMPDKSGVEAAENKLATAASATADANLLDVAAPVVPELKQVDAPYDAEGKRLQTKIMGMYESDLGADPEAAAAEARATADKHMRRAENNADFRRMLAEEKELQARLFSPAQLSSEARIATFGGAAKGRGGMSAAYTDIMSKQRKDLTEGLGRLREIDKARISGDLSTSQTSSLRGSEAASRAASARAAALGGIGAELGRQQDRALQQQKLESQGNVAVYNHQSALAQDKFGAAEAAIERNFQSLKEQVRGENTFYKAKVDLALAAADEQNEARQANLEQLLEVAKAKAEYAFKNGELASKTVGDLQKLYIANQEKATELLTGLMSEDRAYRELSAKLVKLAGSENSPEFKNIEEQIRLLYNAHLETLMTIAPDLFGEQEYLKDVIARAEAGSPFQSSLLPRDSKVTNLDYTPTIPNP